MHGGNALADVVQHAAEAEEIFQTLLHAQLEALLVALLEGHLHRVLDGGEEFDVDLILQQQGQQTRNKGHGCQSVEHMVRDGNVKLALFLTGGQNQAADDIVLEGIQHGLGVRRGLDGMDTAFPCGLHPENRVAGQSIMLLGKQGGRIILIVRQGHHFPELFDGTGIFALEDALTDAAVGPQFDLFQQQSVLNVHELFRTEGQKAAVFFPDFFLGILVKFFLESHGTSSSLSARKSVFHAVMALFRVGIKNGTFCR